MTPAIPKCKDCVARNSPPPIFTSAPRPAPHPGPRCYTHHLAKRRADRARAHGQRVAKVYGITGAEYATLLAHQGGRCALCKRATGKAKRLAVDHDHAMHPQHEKGQGCRECVRGLCCSVCNDVLAHFRDDPALLTGAAAYLLFPPARVVLGSA